jgi:hypothetical protein
MWQPGLQDEWSSSFEGCVRELLKFKAYFHWRKCISREAVSRTGKLWLILREKAEREGGKVSEQLAPEKVSELLTEVAERAEREGQKVSELLAEVANPPSLLEAAMNSVLRYGLSVEEIPHTLKKEVLGWTERRKLRDLQREVRVLDKLLSLKQRWEASRTDEWKKSQLTFLSSFPSP